MVFIFAAAALFYGRHGGVHGAQERIEFEALDCFWDDWGNAFFDGGYFGEA
jgi:hypothetical protein